MLITLGGSFTFVIMAVLAGLPIGLVLSRFIFADIAKKSILTVALSLVSGFALSAIAASWSYGLAGIDAYPVILIALILFSWAALFVSKFRGELGIYLKGWELRDFSLALPIILSIFLTRNHWNGANETVLVSGSGPDTAQNLMAAQSARTLGTNWFNQADNYLAYVNQPNLRDGVMELFRLPSFRDQAGVDYLVYGTRWGLTVPYSQVLRYFGNSAVLWETGLVLLTSLISLAVVVYATSKILAKNFYTPILISAAVVANTPFLVQYFNGGLSQAWALVGNSGIFMSMIIVLRALFGGQSFNPKASLAFISISWIVIAVSYIDSAIVIGLLIIIMSAVFWFKNKAMGLKFLGLFASAGLIAALIVPIFTYASLITFDLRLQAASGTGIPSQIWPLPSELLGFVNIFTGSTEARSPETLLLAIIISIYFLAKLAPGLKKKNNEGWISVAGYGVFAVFGVGLLLSLTGPLGTNYIYLKVATYVSPLALILIFVVLEKSKIGNLKLNKQLTTSSIVPISLVIVAIVSAATAQSGTKQQATTIPYAYKDLLDNSNLQYELEEYNYMLPYVLSSNLFGVFGNVHWISKAPNDIIIGERTSKPIRLMCISSDPSCKPNTAEVPSDLNRFGIRIFDAPITTQEFFNQSLKERFNTNFTVFGQTPQEIPERFIGGNPYFND